MTSWLDYYPCGIEIYGKNVQDICKTKQNVTNSTLVLSKMDQLYKNGYIEESFKNALNNKNSFNKNSFNQDFFGQDSFNQAFFSKKCFFGQDSFNKDFFGQAFFSKKFIFFISIIFFLLYNIK